MNQDAPLYDEVVNGWDRSADKMFAHELIALRQIRQDALENFRVSGFPTIRNEDWKYTNLTRFLKDEYALNMPAAPPVPAKLIASARIADFDCYTIVLVNGSWNKELGAELPKGVEILKVANVKNDPTLVHWFDHGSNDRFFTALNTAFFSDGLFIRVKAGALPDKPLHIIHAYTAGANLMV